MSAKVVMILAGAAVPAALSGFLMVLDGLLLEHDVATKAASWVNPCHSGFGCPANGGPPWGAEYGRAMLETGLGEVFLAVAVSLIVVAFALAISRRGLAEGPSHSG